MANKGNEIRMAALGRRFQVGNLYDYRNDVIISSDDHQLTCDSSDLDVDKKFKLKSSCRDSGYIKDKWEVMNLDEHLQVSAMTELFDKYRGASNYVKDKTNPLQVSQVVVLRAKSRKERLDLQYFPTGDVPRLAKETKATHVVTGVTYGAEAYCVLTQDLDGSIDEEEAREESKKNLACLGNKLVSAFLEDQSDFAEFQEQLNEEEIQSLRRIKCRLYADLQTQSVRECNLSDAHKHCFKLIEQIKETGDSSSKAVPISITLYPLKEMIADKVAGKQLQYRDVDGVLVSDCSRIWIKLESVICKAEFIRSTIKSNRKSLRQFIDAVNKFQNLLKKDLKVTVVKARESEDGNDDAITKFIDLAKKHPLFKSRSLKLWLEYKKAEPKMLEEINNTKGITLFVSENDLLNNLVESEKKYALVLCIPPVDQRTKEILAKMKEYVKSSQTIMLEKDSDQNTEADTEKDGKKQKQVQDKVRELIKHAAKNKHLQNQTQFLMVFGDNREGLCCYSVYESDKVLKENIRQLPRPPTGLKIKAKTSSYVQVEWDHKELDYPFQYLVEYRLKSDDDWKQQKTKPGDHQMTINLKEGLEMEIRVAIDTCIGRSEFSDDVDTNSFADAKTETDSRVAGDNASDLKEKEIHKPTELKQQTTNMDHKPVIKVEAQPARPIEKDQIKKLKSSTSNPNFKGIDRSVCVEMAALGRRFELGNLYDYRNDRITEDWLEFESEMEIEEEYSMQLNIAHPETSKNKWEFLGLDEHMKASTLSGLIDKFKGASNYLNEKTKFSQVSRVLSLRAVTVRKILNLLNPVDYEAVKSIATKSTHVVVGATYGLEAYCVFFQDLDNKESREDADETLSNMVTKIKNSLNEKHDWTEFEYQLAKKDKLFLKEQIKCQLYADYQTQTVRECNVADAYKHCFKLIEQVQQTYVGESKAVPISVSLCPLKRMIGTARRAGKLSEYRDVDDDLISRCCRIWTEMGRICSETESLRATIENKNSRTTLREFVEAIANFQNIFKKDLKIAIVKARETADSDDDEIKKIVEVVERDPLFKPKKLERWLQYKKNELEMAENVGKIKGITIFNNRKEVNRELRNSYDSKYTLVMWIPPLDGKTKEILEAMTNYVGNYSKLVASPSGKGTKDFGNDDEEPWHMNDRKQRFVNGEIRQYANYVDTNLSEKVQFFLASGEIGSKFGCRYSVYKNDTALKEDMDEFIPGPPTNLRIQPASKTSKKSPSICVVWDYEDLGYPHHFVVEYRSKGTNSGSWNQQKTPKQGETQLTINIPAGEVMEVRVAADTCIGRSEFSEIVDTESLKNDDNENNAQDDFENCSQSSEQERNNFQAKYMGRQASQIETSANNAFKQGFNNPTDYQHQQFEREPPFSPPNPAVRSDHTKQAFSPHMEMVNNPSLEDHFDYPSQARKETPTRSRFVDETTIRPMKTETAHNIYQGTTIKSGHAPNYNYPTPYYNPRIGMDQPSPVTFTPQPVGRSTKPESSANNVSGRYAPQTGHRPEQQLPRQVNPPRPAPRSSNTLKPMFTSRFKTASKLQSNNFRFAEAIIGQCEKICHRNGLDVYSVPLTKSSEIGSIGQRFYFGGADGRMQRKTILVMGATGSGKTMLINAMINYVFGVQWTDPFRFQLVQEEVVGQSQAHSQTSKIIAYDIYHQEGFRVPYSLTIVDTPGYGDTKGLDRDKEITEMIRTFFEDKNGIQELNVVGFVAAAPITRLTTTQNYIFDSVLSIFGKDVKDNINFLLTFADSQLPPILNAITEADLSCPTDNQTGHPLHHKFNNSGFFCSNRESGNTTDKFNHFFWRMGIENFDNFFKVLIRMKSKSLSLTKEVLEERKQLEATIDGLQPLIKIGLVKMDEIRKIKEMIANNQKQIEANENVPFEYEAIVTKQVDIPVELFVTNCNKCKVTCHYPCSSEDDGDKFDCSAMDKSMPEADRRCTVCPGKCLWTFHAHQPYRWEYVHEKQATSLEAIKTTYESELNMEMTLDGLIQSLQQTMEENEEAMLEKVETVTKCIARLEEIALRPNPFSSTQYIDLIIDEEMEENRVGFEDRIVSLEKLRTMAEIQEKIRNNISLLE